MPYRRDTGVASVITDSPLLLAALSSGDRHTLAGPVLRAATLVNDLQPPAQHRDVLAAVTWLSGATDVGAAIEALLASPATTPAVRQLIDRLLAAAETRAAGWAK